MKSNIPISRAMRLGLDALRVLGFALTLQMLTAPLALAATLTVDGTCTLADAITAANTDTATGSCPAGSGADTIDLAVNVTLTSALPTINSQIILNGNGHTIARDATAAQFGILDLFFGNLTVNRATITGGSLPSFGGCGGGIRSIASTLTVNYSTISNNTANVGGGIANGCASSLGGTVTINNSTISNNVTSDQGAAVSNDGGTVTINNSTISGNQSGSVGTIDVDCFYGRSTLIINNSTVSGNTAPVGGVSIGERCDATIDSSTITNNSARGLFVDGTFSTATVRNSIIAGQTSGPDCQAVSGGVINSNGHNISSDATCGFTGTGDQQNVSAAILKLGALANNGGPTQTHALLPGSLAIDAGDTGLSTDQRGAARPQGSVDDIGAYEFGATEADFGDAPDTQTGSVPASGTGPADYKTTLADNGPRHVDGSTVFLGTVQPDYEFDGYQSALANGDDNNASPDDEEGIKDQNIPTLTTNQTSVTLKVTATNTTGENSLLVCWIDFDRDGDFENTEEKAILANTVGAFEYSLLFNSYTKPLPEGATFIRCRIARVSDWSAGVSSTGSLATGEVEDYRTTIYKPCALSLKLSGLTPSGSLCAGLQYTVDTLLPGSPISDIASVNCHKTVNIDVPGMTLTPGATSSTLTPPPSWTFNPAVTSLNVQARKADCGPSGTLACTFTDTSGAVCAADPVIEQVVRVKNQPVTVAILDGKKPLSDAFRYVKIQNDDSFGISQLEFNVNGRKFKQAGMQNGGTYLLDIGSGLALKEPNTVTMTAKGKPETSAVILISDEPFEE